MQKLALFLVLLIYSTALSAQWEKAFPELMPGEVTQILERNNGNYAMLVPGRNRLLELSPEGNLVSSYTLPENHFFRKAYSLEEVSNSVLVMVLQTIACASSDQLILEIYSDSTNQILFLDQGENRDMNYVLPLSDQLYLTYSYNFLEGMLQVVTRSGEVLHEMGFAESLEVELQRLNDSTVVIATPMHIITVDTALTVLDTLPEYRGQHIKISESGRLISYDQDSVWLHNNELDLLATVSAASGTKILDISVGFEQIVLFHDNGLLNIYNSSLEPLGGFSIDEGITLSDISITPTGYLIVGQAGMAPFIKHYQFNGISESAGYDVGLLGINLPEIPVVGPKFVPYAVGEVIEVDFPTAQFLVKNFGQDTIQTLFLASNFPWIGYDVWGCFFVEQFRQKYWDQLNLAPGDSKLLEWDIPEVEYITLGAMGNPLAFCVSVEVPSQSFDYNLSNNEHCITTLYVDTPESILHEPQISVFPNPATGQVQVEWSLPVQKPVVLRLHNAIGQLVYEAPGASKSPALLPTQAAGWYVVSLWQEGQRLAQQKVVWH